MCWEDNIFTAFVCARSRPVPQHGEPTTDHMVAWTTDHVLGDRRSPCWGTATGSRPGLRAGGPADHDGIPAPKPHK